VRLGLALLAGCVPLGATAGEVTGRIEAPTRREESLSVDLYAKYDRPAESTPSAGLAGVVALRPLAAPATSSSAGQPPVMDQRGAHFVPRIVPVQAGRSVRFLNSDPVFHNVFSLSPTRRFDLGRYPRGDSRLVRFDRPGVVQVFCDIHAEMTGFVVVLESPYFSVLEAEGGFRVGDVPKGLYEVLVWVEGLGRFETLGQVEVPETGAVEFLASLPGAR
jgi:plastocyanin